MVTTRTYTPVREFKWPSELDVHDLFEMTCKNHPTARYLSKNPWIRGLHFIQGPEEHPFTECSCPFDDLVVITTETGD